MAIYTKTGDKGETKVFDKTTKDLVKVSKSSCQIKSIGAIDELNSFLGIVKSQTKNLSLQKKVEEIQTNLFVINSILAGASLRFSKTKVKKMEKQIDLWEGSLPVQMNFIFYGGSPESSLLFYARALARRAERSLTDMQKESGNIPPGVQIYMNRLSDYLFMMARAFNIESGLGENFWIPKKN